MNQSAGKIYTNKPTEHTETFTSVKEDFSDTLRLSHILIDFQTKEST